MMTRDLHIRLLAGHDRSQGVTPSPGDVVTILGESTELWVVDESGAHLCVCTRVVDGACSGWESHSKCSVVPVALRDEALADLENEARLALGNITKVRRRLSMAGPS